MPKPEGSSILCILFRNYPIFSDRWPVYYPYNYILMDFKAHMMRFFYGH